MSKEKKLAKIVADFIEKHKVSCPESIYQDDEVATNSYEFIEELCNVVGYYQYPED